MASINIYDFSDKINADDKLRQEFINSYVEHLVKTMDVEDIVSAWADMMYDDLYQQCRLNGADTVVERVAESYPDLLKTQYNVDTSLVA